MLSVVNQFWGLDIIDNALQSGDWGICIVKEESELGYIRKQIRFKFMQLNERDKAMIVGLIELRSFESLHPFIRVEAQFLSFFNAGKFHRQGIKVNHCGKEYVIPRFLLATAIDVILHRPEVSTSSSMDYPLLPGVGNQRRFLHIDAEIR